MKLSHRAATQTEPHIYASRIPLVSASSRQQASMPAEHENPDRTALNPVGSKDPSVENLARELLSLVDDPVAFEKRVRDFLDQKLARDLEKKAPATARALAKAFGDKNERSLGPSLGGGVVASHVFKR